MIAREPLEAAAMSADRERKRPASSGGSERFEPGSAQLTPPVENPADARSWPAVLMCTAAVLPAQFLGSQVFYLYRWLFNQAVFAFNLFWMPLALLQAVESWGAWILDGLTTGIAAVFATAIVLRRDVLLGVVIATTVIWAVLKAAEYVVAPGLEPLAPWPYSGTIGFVLGLLGGLAGGAAIARH